MLGIWEYRVRRVGCLYVLVQSDGRLVRWRLDTGFFVPSGCREGRVGPECEREKRGEARDVNHPISSLCSYLLFTSRFA